MGCSILTKQKRVVNMEVLRASDVGRIEGLLKTPFLPAIEHFVEMENESI